MSKGKVVPINQDNQASQPKPRVPSFLRRSNGGSGGDGGSNQSSESKVSELPPCVRADLDPAHLARLGLIDKYGSPSDWGLPPKFKSFRGVQLISFEDIRNHEDRRFFVLCQPTGTGKTVTYMAAREVLNLGRMVVCTATKALTKQIIDDFGDGKIAGTKVQEIKGRNSFNCLTGKQVRVSWKTGEKRKATCEDGDAVNCPYQGPKFFKDKEGNVTENPMHLCPYKLQIDEALEADVVVPNYHYWITVNMYLWDDEEGCNNLGPFDTLVLDEAHNLVSILSDFAKIQFVKTDTVNLKDGPEKMDDGCEDWDRWRSYSLAGMRYLGGKMEENLKTAMAIQHPPDIEKLEEEDLDPKERERIEKHAEWFNSMDEDERAELFKTCMDQNEKFGTTSKKLDLIYKASHPDKRSNWIIDWDKKKEGTVEFNPIDLKGWCERVLFAGIKRILVPSATVRSKTMQLLGVEPDQYWFREYPSPFDPKKVPVIWVPTARLDYRSEQDWHGVVLPWLERIDEIIRTRQDRKGIIHTVSYKRARLIKEHSDYSGLMTIPEQGRIPQTVDLFKKMARPGILVHPALTTGYDFPGWECEYQIITKIPFPNFSSMSKVMKIRNERDPGYTKYLTVQDLVQACGRGSRKEEDICETFIIDDHCGHVIWGSGTRGMVPGWFLQFACKQRDVPRPGKSMLQDALEGYE